MANHVSALKRARQTVTKTAFNRANKSRMRSALRNLRTALTSGDKTTLETTFRRRFGCNLIVAQDGPRDTLRRYASGLVAHDGMTPPIVFDNEIFPRGGVAILTAEQATAALDRAVRLKDQFPPAAA